MFIYAGGWVVSFLEPESSSSYSLAVAVWVVVAHVRSVQTLATWWLGMAALRRQKSFEAYRSVFVRFEKH